MKTPIALETLTDAMIREYFARHCRCAKPDVERLSHTDIDCDLDACEDARVALGGRPNGCGYRSTVEAIIHTRAARLRIIDVMNINARAEADES